MKVDRKDINQGIWFYYEDSPEDSFGLQLRIPNRDKIQEMIVESSTVEEKEVNGEIITDTRVDEAKFGDLLLNYTINNWKGIEDENGPIPCVFEEKKLIVNEVHLVRIFYFEKMDKLQTMLKLRQEKAKKN